MSNQNNTAADLLAAVLTETPDALPTLDTTNVTKRLIDSQENLDMVVAKPIDLADSTESITNRTTPCRCGCKGSDPWHKAEYKRVIRNKVIGSTTREDAGRIRIIATGVAKLPGRSAAIVRHTEWKHEVFGWLDLGWEVDRAATVWDA